MYSGAAAVGTRKGVFKVADFLVAHDRLGHRSGQTLRYLLPSVWLVFLGRQGVWWFEYLEWRKKEGWEEDVSSKGPLWRFSSLLSFLLGVVWQRRVSLEAFSMRSL